MKTLVLNCLLPALLLTGINVKADVYAQHPKPQNPTLLDESFYQKISRALPPPPQPGSLDQRRDEKILRSLQQSRAKADCERANSEVSVDFKTFFVTPAGPLTNAEFNQIRSLAMAVGQDAYYFVSRLKEKYPRPRPFDYIAGLEPCVPKESTLSYPSGHAVISALVATVAADIFPTKAIALKERAEVIARDRVLGGVHHPSDIEAGKLLAKVIYNELQKTRAFRNALREAKRVDMPGASDVHHQCRDNKTGNHNCQQI